MGIYSNGTIFGIKIYNFTKKDIYKNENRIFIKKSKLFLSIFMEILFVYSYNILYV